VESRFEDILRDSGTLVYTNVGCSMMPLLRQGKDIIIIRRKEPAERLHWLDVPLYRRGDKYILHRVIAHAPGGYICMGDNCEVPERVSEEQVIGVLQEVVRDGKNIQMDSFSMRLHAILTLLCWPFRCFRIPVRRYRRRHASK